MIVFNVNAVVQLVLALIPAGIAAGAAWALGADWEYWLALIGALCVMPIDVLWRAAGMFGEEGEESEGGAGVLNIVYPSGGGHLFFLPMWLIGGLAAVGLCVGWFAS